MSYRLTYVIIILASLLFGACSVFDDNMYGPNGEQRIRVSFVLALDSSENGPLTKADETWDPGTYGVDFIGDGFDNTILLEGLQIVFYTPDNRFYTKVDIEEWVNVDKDGNPVTGDHVSNLYQFSGTAWIEEEYVLDDTNKLKMMVFANYDQMIDIDTDLSALTFDYDCGYIPMWGVQTVSVKSLVTEGMAKPVIYVLRAMAKVEVSLSDDLVAQGYTLTQLKMNNLNTKGYLLPASQDKPSTEALTLQESFRPYDMFKLEHNVTGDARSLVMYVPEYDNDSKPSEIYLSLKCNEDGVIYSVSPKAPIEFKNYTGGKPVGDAYDIYRNHNYHFEITGVNKEEARVNLVKIEDLELGGRYGFEF